MLFDTDADGVNDETADYDADGTPNFRDIDADDDGSSNTSASGNDSDGDELDDAFDINDLRSDAVNNPTNAGQVPGSFPDDDPSQSGGEPDWRDTGSAFPVEWLSFEVSLSGHEAIIAWATASEINSDFFEIERSENGQHFESIGIESAIGNTQEITHYRFVDPAATSTAAPRLFYRLRQVDLDGAFSNARKITSSFCAWISFADKEEKPSLVPIPGSGRLFLTQYAGRESQIPIMDAA